MKIRVTTRPLDVPVKSEGQYVAITLSTGEQFILQEVHGRLRVKADSARDMVVVPVDYRSVEIAEVKR